jgi:hypothetical protein
MKEWKLGMVVHFCNPSTWVDKAGRSQVRDQTELHVQTLSQKTTHHHKKKKKKRKEKKKKKRMEEKK